MTTPLPPELGPQALSARRDVAIVDIRDHEEHELIGSIPGAYPFPQAALTSEPWRLMAVVPPDRPVALACMSGRRSLEAMGLARDIGFSSVCNLRGGVLGWASAGLPLSGLSTPSESAPVSMAALERELISCFAAERIEVVLDTGDEAALLDDPSRRARELLAALKEEQPDLGVALDEAINRLGLLAWTGGHPLDHIAANIDRMRGWLQRLAA